MTQCDPFKNPSYTPGVICNTIIYLRQNVIFSIDTSVSSNQNYLGFLFSKYLADLTHLKESFLLSKQNNNKS